MAVAFKVADSSGRYSSSKQNKLAPLDKYYVVLGFWPKYEVGEFASPERTVIWGRKALKAWEVSMRMEGYKKWKKG